MFHSIQPLPHLHIIKNLKRIHVFHSFVAYVMIKYNNKNKLQILIKNHPPEEQDKGLVYRAEAADVLYQNFRKS